jgi:hypothetical protein
MEINENEKNGSLSFRKVIPEQIAGITCTIINGDQQKICKGDLLEVILTVRIKCEGGNTLPDHLRFNKRLIFFGEHLSISWGFRHKEKNNWYVFTRDSFFAETYREAIERAEMYATQEIKKLQAVINERKQLWDNGQEEIRKNFKDMCDKTKCKAVLLQKIERLIDEAFES